MEIMEFDSKGRYCESPCFGCQLETCGWCPRESGEAIFSCGDAAAYGDASPGEERTEKERETEKRGEYWY